jgi:hypothetical protein
MATTCDSRKRSGDESDLPAAKRPCFRTDLAAIKRSIDDDTYKSDWPRGSIGSYLVIDDGMVRTGWPEGEPFTGKYADIIDGHPTLESRNGRELCDMCFGPTGFRYDQVPDLNKIPVALDSVRYICDKCRVHFGICPSYKGGDFGLHLTWAKSSGAGFQTERCGRCEHDRDYDIEVGNISDDEEEEEDE